MIGLTFVLDHETIKENDLIPDLAFEYITILERVLGKVKYVYDNQSRITVTCSEYYFIVRTPEGIDFVYEDILMEAIAFGIYKEDVK